MILRLISGLPGLLAAFLFAGGYASVAQQSGSPSDAAVSQSVRLAEVVRNLPRYVQLDTQSARSAYSGALENATVAERDSSVLALMQWVSDDRPEVRSLALITVHLLYLPSEKRPGERFSTSFPVRFVPLVAAHLRDADLSVRRAAFGALELVEYSGLGMDDLVKLVVPMLRGPDVLTEDPNPFFIESDKRMLSGMSLDQQAAFRARPRKVIKLPAEGPGLLAILTLTRQPSDTVDDAMIAFLDREDQTKTTLKDCLHIFALSSASERVNDEALRRVFEKKAMTIFLLQFVADMRLTSAQLTVQRERLMALTDDESAHPALRRSAKDVAACWNGERTGQCKPSSKDSSEQLDTNEPEGR